MKQKITVSRDEIAALVLEEAKKRYSLEDVGDSEWVCELFLNNGEVQAEVKEVPTF